MSTLKYALGSTMASAALFLAPAVPVAAFGGGTNDSNNTSTNTNTETKTINIGQCSVRFDDIETWLDQNGNSQGSENENEIDGDRNDDNTAGGNSSNQSQSNGQSVVITVSPNCSVTNVTNAAAPVVAGAQVEAAKGGVSAGFGAVASSFVASIGAVGSVLGAGLGIRRFGN